MKNRTKLRVVAILLATLILPAAFTSTIVHADEPTEDRSQTPVAKANPQISDALLNSLPESVLDDGDLYVDPEILPGAPFVMPDGDENYVVVPGQSKEQTQAAQQALAEPQITCWTSAAVPALMQGVEVSALSGGCPAIIGYVGYIKGYVVNTNPSSNGVVS